MSAADMNAAAVREAYAVCGRIARREAKNFYYAFLALPEKKRNAMYAIYAFMRRADDIADDETQPVETRRREMQAWLADWHQAEQCEAERGGAERGEEENAVFLAVRDAQARFKIPGKLLDQLVDGVTMDLKPATGDLKPAKGDLKPEAGVQSYRNFEELYRYCYLVASVVGLVCIRVFGYADAAAEKLAEETGIAFQLTNILRDVREDAARGRLYLPAEDLERFSIAPERIIAAAESGRMDAALRPLLEFEAARAMEYYGSADRLLPLIDADSRPALRVLVTIYRGLLLRVIASQYDVFSRRVSVPAWRKTAILLRGMAPMLLQRAAGAGRRGGA